MMGLFLDFSLFVLLADPFNFFPFKLPNRSLPSRPFRIDSMRSS